MVFVYFNRCGIFWAHVYELLRIKWWNYNYSDLPDNNKCDDINYFVEEMNRLISDGNIQERDYKKFNLSEVFRGL